MISHNGGDFPFPHQIGALIRIGVVAYHVAEADYLVHAQYIDPFQDSLERLQIRVDV